MPGCDVAGAGIISPFPTAPPPARAREMAGPPDEPHRRTPQGRVSVVRHILRSAWGSAGESGSRSAARWGTVHPPSAGCAGCACRGSGTGMAEMQRLGIGVARCQDRAAGPRPARRSGPRYMTAILSEMCLTTDRSWAMKMMARFISRCRVSSRFTIWDCTRHPAPIPPRHTPAAWV